ncbi:hypothetical protein [Paracidovorax valerianellae]|nr:hypothetical protein [Paracidovorax valerianellae]MDA8445715.1 hypothetical protein [Paracidovorax valerianellae]
MRPRGGAAAGSSSSAAARPPRANAPGRPGVAATALSSPSPAAQAALATVNGAVHDLGQYHGLANIMSLETHAPAMRKTSSIAFVKAKGAMEALGKLTMAQAHDVGPRIPMFFEQQRTMAAYRMVMTTSKIDASSLAPKMMLSPDAASTQALWAGYVERADAQLKELEPCAAALAETVKSLGKREAFESTPDSATTLKAAVMGVAKSRLIAINSHVDRVLVSVMMLTLADEAESVSEKTREMQKELVGDVVRMRSMVDLLQDARVGPQPAKEAWLQNYVKVLERHAHDHLRAATRDLPPHQDLSSSLVGRAALEMAASIRLLTTEIGEVLNAYKLSPQIAERVHDLTTEGQSTTAREASVESEEPAAAAQEAAASEQAAQAQSSRPGRRSRRNAKATHSAPGSSAAAASKPGLSVQQQVHIELAQARVSQFRKPPPTPSGARFDFFALAASMKQDTKDIRAALDAGTDPVNAGQMMRRALAQWFGQPGIWAQRSQQLEGLTGVDLDPKTVELKKEVAQRAEQVQALHDQVSTFEIDLVKQYTLPKANHVSMLLNSGEAMPDGTVRKLPSSGDPDGDHGTLFEVRLAVKPLSNGQPAAPLYVHFHTQSVVGTDAIASISPDQLAAVHVKTADQRALGPKWEALNAALLGPVHRGALTDQVLMDLQKRLKG